MSETFELFQKGKQHLANGMPAQAIVSLERAKRREPRKASIREALGIAYFRLRRFEEAEAEFRAMIEITPTDAYGYYGLGRSLGRLGRSAEARGQLKLARILSPLEAPPGSVSDDS
ncbi:MAG TPA: tetratricopeptide repeat protein [Gaiellaceae bacterium]|jgi:Flp pilus assembly protein TadD